jgi:hypothetical protein
MRRKGRKEGRWQKKRKILQKKTKKKKRAEDKRRRTRRRWQMVEAKGKKRVRRRE